MKADATGERVVRTRDSFASHCRRLLAKVTSNGRSSRIVTADKQIFVVGANRCRFCSFQADRLSIRGIGKKAGASRMSHLLPGTLDMVTHQHTRSIEHPIIPKYSQVMLFRLFVSIYLLPKIKSDTPASSRFRRCGIIAGPASRWFSGQNLPRAKGVLLCVAWVIRDDKLCFRFSLGCWT